MARCLAASAMGSWFYELFGEEEACCTDGPTSEAYEATRCLFRLEAGAVGPAGGDVLVAPNGRRFFPGAFESPQLAELRGRIAAGIGEGGQPLQLVNIEGEARGLHVQASAGGAVFQVASQFNCLEFVDASLTPEHGVTRYLFDKSQGPACALACAASTVWRNYFLPVEPEGTGHRGQRAACQLNCLRDVQALLGEGLVDVRNGYTSSSCLERLAERVGALSEDGKDEVRAALRIGVQWNAEVTDMRVEHQKNPATNKWEKATTRCDPVTQVFCSALSIHPSAAPLWEPLARLVLDAAYEATLAVAALNLQRGASRDVYLTLLGAANFHNKPEWIEGAIRRALEVHRQSGLRVHIVHFSSSSPQVGAYHALAAEWNARVAGSPDGAGLGPSSVGAPTAKGKGKATFAR